MEFSDPVVGKGNDYDHVLLDFDHFSWNVDPQRQVHIARLRDFQCRKSYVDN